MRQYNILHQHHPLWELAFRAGFLCAACFGVLAMGRWLQWALQPADWDYALYPAWWHAHEMIFGFAMPVVAGFLLTAVANWTGLPGTTGWRLQLLFALWLSARLLLWLMPDQRLLAWLAEMLFIALLTWELTRRVWQKRQWRNGLFTPVLLLLALLCSASYVNADDAALSQRLHYGALWMITTVVVIIGGRVIPLFTGNRLGVMIAPPREILEYTAIAITALIAVAFTLSSSPTSTGWLQALCLVGAIIHLLRMVRWQGWLTLKVPLLWSLHLSYLCIPLALLGLGLADSAAETKNIVHLLAIGSIGGMILNMMSRVSLGHTGRPLTVPWYLAVAFALVFIAALTRAFLPMLDANMTHWAWRISAGLWIVAFALFLLRYLNILTQPRADAKTS